MNGKDLQALSQARLVEAKALLAADLPGGAYYLAGYSVECALKACIAKQTRRYDFPEKRWAEKAYTHDLAKLVTHANLESSRSAEASNDPAFRNYAVDRREPVLSERRGCREGSHRGLR